MKGPFSEQPSLFGYSQTEDFVPANHPIRRIRGLVGNSSEAMRHTLNVSYSHTGRPSIAPERPIRALLLQVLYSIRSEHQRIEQLQYNMLYRWFVGLSLDDAVSDQTTFGKNRVRLIDHGITAQLMEAVVDQDWKRQLISGQHFCVDDTLIDVWASMGSYRRKEDDDDPPAGPPNFQGERCRSDTHECKTDTDVRLHKKASGQPSRLCYIGHVLTDNRHALMIDTEVTRAVGKAEVDAAITMLDRRPGKCRLTVGADKNYGQERFVATQRKARITPHVASKKHFAIDQRTTRHPGHTESIHARHRVETPVGYGKFNRTLRKAMLRGLNKVGDQARLLFTSYNNVMLYLGYGTDAHGCTGGGMNAVRWTGASEIRQVGQIAINLSAIASGKLFFLPRFVARKSLDEFLASISSAP